MKKLLILFSVTNIFLGLLLLAIEAGKPTTPLSVEMTATYSIITLFFITGAGLLLKRKFAWTLNLLLATLTVSVVLSAIINSFTWQDHLNLLWPTWLILLKLFINSLVLVSLFSLLRTLKSDFTSALKIGPRQKRLTMIFATLLSATWLITTLAFP